MLPTLVRQSGERIPMAQDLAALQERRVKLQEQIDEVDTKILDLKRERAAELLAELKELGYDTGGKRAKKEEGTVIRRRDPNKPCAVCEYVTAPGHDARMHRSQGKSKKPFNAEELKEKGLKKVSM